MAFKAVNGKVRTVILLPEEVFREFERVASESGLTVSDVIRLKLTGFEAPRRAA